MAFLCLGGLTGLRIMPVAGVVSLAIMWAGTGDTRGASFVPSIQVSTGQSGSQIVTPN